MSPPYFSSGVVCPQTARKVVCGLCCAHGFDFEFGITLPYFPSFTKKIGSSSKLYKDHRFLLAHSVDLRYHCIREQNACSIFLMLEFERRSAP